MRLESVGDKNVSTALQIAEALGYDVRALAELLPFVLIGQSSPN
jgi:hypothetical protein